jgi:hypothetical protein
MKAWKDVGLGVLVHLKTFTKERHPDGGPVFLGEQFSMVDLLIAPWA